MAGSRGVALVAGGSGGIGGATCDRLGALGYTVASVSRSGGGRADVALSADLTVREETERAVNEICGLIGAPSIVIHAVGEIFDQQPIANADWRRWQRTLDVCLGSAVNLARSTFDHLCESSGCFVAVSSVASHHHYDGITDYCAAKAALEAMIRGLACELAPSGARAVSIAPAVVDTALFRRSPYSEDEASSWHKLGRIGRPEDVAGLIAYVVSPAASWMTGSTVTLDGGMGL